MKKVEGNIVDVFERRIYPGEILISPDGKFQKFCLRIRNMIVSFFPVLSMLMCILKALC